MKYSSRTYSISELKTMLREERTERDRLIRDHERELKYFATNISELKRALRDYPTEKSFKLPKRVKKLSSVKRYKMFNEMLRRAQYRSYNIYRDRLKSGNISVKVNGIKPAHKIMARKLADKVSATKVTYEFGFKLPKPYNLERYIFWDIPGKSKYAPGASRTNRRSK